MRAPKGYITVHQAALRFGVSDTTIARWIKDDTIEHTVAGDGDNRRYYILETATPENTKPIQFPVCGNSGCRFNNRKRCYALTECLWAKGEGCPFFKPKKGKYEDA